MNLILRISDAIKASVNRFTKAVMRWLVSNVYPEGYYFLIRGYCPCCESETKFYSKKSWLRDNLRCINCRCIPRERALMVAIEKYYPNWETLTIHESSPGNRGASLRLKKRSNNYIASQFYPDKSFGEKVGEFHNQDLENQTFKDESFDLVITQDVMEHIYSPEKAFSEIARTLKSGGAHIFTVPIINKHKKTEIWALKGDNGEPKFIGKPEWHGNPVSSKGSPVTMHWGYDIIDFISKYSGLKTTIEYLYDPKHGITAEYIEVLVSKKE